MLVRGFIMGDNRSISTALNAWHFDVMIEYEVVLTGTVDSRVAGHTLTATVSGIHRSTVLTLRLTRCKEMNSSI